MERRKPENDVNTIMEIAQWTTVGCWEALAGNAASLERILFIIYFSFI